jgi:hypothetical protein
MLVALRLVALPLWVLETGAVRRVRDAVGRLANPGLLLVVEVY